MPLPSLPANWTDNGPLYHAADQNKVEAKVNENAAAIASIPSGAGWGGVTISGAPTTGQVPTATSTSAATWQTPPGGGASGWGTAVTLTGTPTAGQVPTATSGSAASWQTPVGGGGLTPWVLRPEAYGAVGDGTTNDTAAMQSWLDAVTGGSGYNTGVLGAGKIYKITAALVISNGSGGWPNFIHQWHIDGQGSIIRQATNNLAIFKFTGEGLIGCSIKRIYFDYTNQQTAGSGKPVILIDPATNFGYGLANWTFEELGFSGKCYRGFAFNEASANYLTVWGTTFRNITGYEGMTGGLFRLRANLGAPNNSFEHCYQHRGSCSEPTIDLELNSAVRISNLETNSSNLGGTLVALSACPDVQMHTIRDEIGVDTAGVALYTFDQCPTVTVSNWEVINRPFNNGGGGAVTGTIFRLTTSSSITLRCGAFAAYSGNLPGSNATVLSNNADTSSKCLEYKQVARPSAVHDFNTGFAVTTGVQAFPSGFGITTLASY